MNPVLALMKIWTFLRSFPFVWKIIRNYSDIKQILSDMVLIFESARNNGGLPTCNDTVKLLDCVEKIFEKELIDIPDVDEVALAEMLREFKENLNCAVKTERVKRGIHNE